MQWFTPVQLPPPFLSLTPHSHVVFLGSCFAEHIGEHLAHALPEGQVETNPFGPLYNPASLLRATQLLLSEEEPDWTREAFETAEGTWRHWRFSTRYEAPTREALCRLLSATWQRARQTLLRADALCLTLSTTQAWLLHDGPQDWPVANCHKQPARLFRKTALDLDGQLAAWTDCLQGLRSRLPALRVLFTLSPYRYLSDGLHANAVAKATLLLLMDQLQQRFPGLVAYFPAFEIVTDELRDYRFYAPDMLHPSDTATDYVWERFRTWAFSPDLRDFAAEREALLRAEAHRPLHPDSEAHRRFLEQLERRRQAFDKRWGEEFGIRN